MLWQDAAANLIMKWDKRLDLFQAAMMAKNSITEMTREANQQNPRIRTLMGDLEEDPANKKVINVMYLSLGEAARKHFKDKYPHTALWELKAQELITPFNDCFRKKSNRTIDRHRFLSRLQKPGETLFQFWHALNGLAAICDFGDITTTLVLDMFILHMSNKKVHKKLCTEPKEPDQALEFAIAFEEGIKMRKDYGIQVSAKPAKASVKSEHVFAVEKTNPRECFRCGEGNFIMELVNCCLATNHRCNFCELIGHVEKCCDKKFPQRHKEMVNRLKKKENPQSMRRGNYIEESEDESEEK